MSETSDRRAEQVPTADVGDQLQRTIDILCEAAARVELWACALSGFAQPVPDYDPGVRYHLESKPNQG